MLARVHAACLIGIEAQSVEVEAHLGKGLPGFELVGLPEAAVRESQVRIRAAIAYTQCELPPRNIVVNLAPADRRKSGSAFDLAIAVALLTAAAKCPSPVLEETLVVGELSLDGSLRNVKGILSFLKLAQSQGLKRAIIPRVAAATGAWIDGLNVYCAHHLSEVMHYLQGKIDLPQAAAIAAERQNDPDPVLPSLDLDEVRGQEIAKRALEIAALGRHHVLMCGPPGAGKSMLAQRFVDLLPPPSREEALEIATVASVVGADVPADLSSVSRPYRAPHYLASDAAILGGGHPAQPGEITLAHQGVLFLDELPHFRRSALEGLRTTMELGQVTIARVHQRITMPAKAQIIAAMNPCACGFHADEKKLCRCSASQLAAYQQRISGPLLDRFDLHLAVAAVRVDDLNPVKATSSSLDRRARLMAAHAFRQERTAHQSLVSAGDLFFAFEQPAVNLLDQAYESLGLSARVYFKMLHVARSIADLEQSESVRSAHIAEALQYRVMDHQYR